MHRPHATPTFPEHSAAKRVGCRLAWLMFLGCTWAAFAAAAQTGRATNDSNGDGVLDEQELRAAAKATFAGADADADGYLTIDELSAARMAGDVERRTRGLGSERAVATPRRPLNVSTGSMPTATGALPRRS